MFRHLSHDEEREIIGLFKTMAHSLGQIVEGQKQTNALLKQLTAQRKQAKTLIVTLGTPVSQ